MFCFPSRAVNEDAPLLTDWMADLPDEVAVSSLHIAGTHQSCAFYGLISRCQSSLLKWQLDHGIRCLDLRFSIIKGRLLAYHGPTSQRATARDIFHTVLQFLLEHPSELVICSVQQENRAVDLFQVLMQQIIDETPGQWYLENQFPKVGQARGKIVLFSRYGRGDQIGLHPPIWPDNSPTIFTYSVHETKVHTQDWYSPGSILRLPEKFALMKDLFLNWPHDTSHPAFRLNFCSASTFISAVPSVFALGLGFSFFGITGINQRLYDLLLSLRSAPVEKSASSGHCFMLDFCHEPSSLIETIISFNDHLFQIGKKGQA